MESGRIGVGEMGMEGRTVGTVDRGQSVPGHNSDKPVLLLSRHVGESGRIGVEEMGMEGRTVGTVDRGQSVPGHNSDKQVLLVSRHVGESWENWGGRDGDGRENSWAL